MFGYSKVHMTYVLVENLKNELNLMIVHSYLETWWIIS